MILAPGVLPLVNGLGRPLQEGNDLMSATRYNMMMMLMLWFAWTGVRGFNRMIEIAPCSRSPSHAGRVLEAALSAA
jgi:hypothetical protein